MGLIAKIEEMRKAADVQAHIKGLKRRKAELDESRPAVYIEGQGSLFKVKVYRPSEGKPAGVGARRGNISEFSPASRKRLVEQLARISKAKAYEGTKPSFMTLTYGSTWPTDGAVVKRHLDRFNKAMKARFPRVSGVWKLEFQKRGAPHFHIIYFGLPFVDMGWVRTVWSRIIDFKDWAVAPGGARCELTVVRSWRGLLSYASKYMAKPAGDGPVGVERGRQPEPSAPQAAAGGVSLSISHNAKEEGEASVEDLQEFQHVGRFWGVIGRKYLPVGVLTNRIWNYCGAVHQLKRMARHFYAGVNAKRYSGFTLFTADNQRWVKLSDYIGRFTHAQDLPF